MSAHPHSPEAKRYWRSKRTWTLALLGAWWLLAFGTTYFARELDTIWLGWPVGFWIAAQGAPLGFLLIVALYAAVMEHLDARYERH